jgi:hypothetical protein
MVEQSPYKKSREEDMRPDNIAYHLDCMPEDGGLLQYLIFYESA